MAYDLPTRSPEVLARHADACPARDGAPCTCGPIGYRPARDGRSAGPLMETEAQAHAWRREQDAGLDAAERDPTVSVAIDEFVEAVAADRARDPDGRRYTAAGLRELRSTLSAFSDHLLDEPAVDRVPREATAPARPGMVSDEAIWLCLKVATVVFVLIALILAAESI